MAVQYTGIDELIRSLKELAPATEKKVRERLREAGGTTATSATQRLLKYGVAGRVDFRVRVRTKGLVQVEEAKRRKTGKRPDFGALQMRRGLLPARDAELDKAVVGLDRDIDRIVRQAGF